MVTSTDKSLNSALYTGTIQHRRHTPVINSFSYPLFMVALNLDELDTVFKNRWCWSTSRPALARFRRSDYLRNESDPATPLKQAALDLVSSHTGKRPGGPVRLLTHLRYFGYGFNPVNFYFCYNIQGDRIEAIIAEINNTPWGEQHSYVLDCAASENSPFEFSFDKEFHISPFNPMDQHYHWRFRIDDSRCLIHMQNFMANTADKHCVFDATLTLEQQPITGCNLAAVLCRYPWMTAQVIVLIYWQAFKLWCKRSPVYDHPDNGKRTNQGAMK